MQKGPSVLDKVIADQKGYTEMFPGLFFDWSLMLPPKIDQYLRFSLKGLFFEESAGPVEPPVAMPNMPERDDAFKAKYQAFVSAYLLESLTAAYIKVHQP